MPKWQILACGQRVLPERSTFIGQILMENAKIQTRHFEEFAVKKCYQTGHFWFDKNWWKKPKFKCDILINLQTMCPRIITKSTGSIFRQYLIFYGQNMKEIWHHLIFVMRCQDPLKCAASQNSSVTHCDKISNFVHMLKFGSFKFSRAFSRFGIFNYLHSRTFFLRKSE